MKRGEFTWRQIWNCRTVRYLCFGALTVGENLLCFYFLTAYTDWDSNLSNGISIFTALLFAYATNTRFVFCSKCSSLCERFSEFIRFLMARIFTMLLEFGGVYFMICVLDMNEMLSKGLLQVVVIVLNYILSRLMIYRD